MMKNLIIIGAGGSLAKYVIEELQKQKDVRLTLFLRNKNRLSNRNMSNTAIVEGDVKGTAISRKSIAAFVAEIVNTPDKYSRENFGIAKPTNKSNSN